MLTITITNWNIEYLIFFIVLVMIYWVSITVYNYTKKITPQTLIINESVIVKDEIISSENSHLEQENVKNEHDNLCKFDNGYEMNRLFEESNENKDINDLTNNLTNEEIRINSSTSFQFISIDKEKNNSLLENTDVSNYDEITSEPFHSYCDSRNESDTNTENTNQSSIELQKSENEILEATRTHFTTRKNKYTRRGILIQTTADNKKDDIEVLDTSNETEFDNTEERKNYSLLQNTEVSNYDEISSEPVLSCDSNNESDTNTKNTYQNSTELQKSENEILEATRTYFTTRKNKYTRHGIKLYETTADNKKDDIEVLDTSNEIELDKTENTEYPIDGNVKELIGFDISSSLPSTIHSNSATDIQFVEDVSDINFYNITTSVDPMNDGFIQLDE